MNWTHSSRLLGVLLVVSVLAVGTAAAIGISGSAPAPANVNDSVSMSVEIQDPFEGQANQWTLRGSSGLDEATFTVEVYAQGRLVSQQGPVRGPVNQSLDFEASPTPNRVVVNVSGGVPPLESFDYRNRSAEEYTVLRLENAGAGTALETYRAHRFTDASDAARDAIDAARSAIDGLEQPPEAAENDLQRAIEAYDGEQFGLAQDLASEAEEAADERAEQEESGLPVVLIGGAVLVLLLIAGGALYAFGGGGDEDYKLQ
jgi:hypothetical protein